MIQNAHIGIGISGLEGRQAVLASDFSIAQFRFLERLLLVHGRWSYLRMSRFLSYFFYKNFAFTLCQFWYAIFSGWSGQTIFDATFVTMYNVIFTSLPIIAAGLFEQDVTDRVSQLYPHMYQVGQKDLLFNTKIFSFSLVLGVYHSFVCFFFAWAATGDNILSDGHTYGYQWLGVMISGAVVVVVNLQIAVDLYRWTIINHVFVWLSIISWWIFTWFQYSMPALVYMVGFYGVNFNSQGEWLWWWTVLLSVVVCILPVHLYKYIRVYFYPTPVDIVREITYLSRAAREGQGILADNRGGSVQDIHFQGSTNFNATLLAAVSGVDIAMDDVDDDEVQVPGARMSQNSNQSNARSLTEAYNQHREQRVHLDIETPDGVELDMVEISLTDNPRNPRSVITHATAHSRGASIAEV
ncbi:hypothetical protein SARC_04820 [Sphaeroforma arctica JP610]|uniref:P-type ATPase C-terminal domain-containing protein n=1 Tax=Sphaeroforma arctica JP610 TaxID=667725 RepID=A0A0L0G1C4_9EUKA|nr:hypothetical protein SARC_04820 [Sphaeroforma arctica JP610]KNC82900.1 hypothetical protein SARC_04820 [Sphaeroforma arctica JP610]|eukprot:XP_014156802.1 hypothetical protein SARC_04820 [Sphaeroforma arctica JP610]